MNESTPRTDEAYILRLLGRIADLERELKEATASKKFREESTERWHHAEVAAQKALKERAESELQRANTLDEKRLTLEVEVAGLRAERNALRDFYTAWKEIKDFGGRYTMQMAEADLEIETFDSALKEPK